MLERKEVFFSSSESEETFFSVLGPDAEFEGVLVANGSISIHGCLVGEIETQGCLLLAETSVVKARVLADEVIIAGELQGDVCARQRAELRATARVQGSLHAPSLALADGASLQGRCAAGDCLAEAASAPNVGSS